MELRFPLCSFLSFFSFYWNLLSSSNQALQLTFPLLNQLNSPGLRGPH